MVSDKNYCEIVEVLLSYACDEHGGLGISEEEIKPLRAALNLCKNHSPKWVSIKLRKIIKDEVFPECNEQYSM